MSVLMKGLSCSTGGDSGLRQTSSPVKLVTDLALLVSSSNLSMTPKVKHNITKQVLYRKQIRIVNELIPLRIRVELTYFNQMKHPRKIPQIMKNRGKAIVIDPRKNLIALHRLMSLLHVDIAFFSMIQLSLL